MIATNERVYKAAMTPAREQRARLTARLKLLEARSNDAIARGDIDDYRDADDEWHRILVEWMAASEAVEAERGRI